MDFLGTIGSALYSMIVCTNKIMETLIKQTYPVHKNTSVKSFLDNEEAKALHYTASYVIPSLVKVL